ncbi:MULTISPECIES: hypothetical protein [Nitrospirillum]|uniref:Uncharacterized protein n=1 Tax=Nitrospirillum amazonense TaxID=28077 RepID=A0A560G330_9PROT|nr:hypothetical protein [Nitrospirillum amazonense]TWB21734.1 hypothetical protein FBZ88_11788 [Nitrospirillum amazonense]TWB28269.1 hypothetical protein FBZ91_12920 [Nitrospirillum amazonense]
MMTDTHSAPAWRRPSPGYLFHLALAVVGITFLAIGLDGSLKLRAQLDPVEALDGAGLVGFLFSWALVFGFRLIFWGRVPSQTQGLVRLLLSAIFAVEVVATIVALGLLFTQPGGVGGSVLVTVFTLAAALCQISTIIWLLRYRKE